MEIPATLDRLEWHGEFVASLSFRSMEIVDPSGITDQPRPLLRWVAFRACRLHGPVLPSLG